MHILHYDRFYKLLKSENKIDSHNNYEYDIVIHKTCNGNHVIIDEVQPIF